MKEIKQLFFTYRNGAVADTLRRLGMPHKVIFGLEIPRIAEIASQLEPSEELANRLWADADVRESRLLATYLFPIKSMTSEKALQLATVCRTQEEADMLAFRLLKRLPFAADLLHRLNSNPACTSAAKALRRHLE